MIEFQALVEHQASDQNKMRLEGNHCWPRLSFNEDARMNNKGLKKQEEKFHKHSSNLLAIQEEGREDKNCQCLAHCLRFKQSVNMSLIRGANLHLNHPSKHRTRKVPLIKLFSLTAVAIVVALLEVKSDRETVQAQASLFSHPIYLPSSSSKLFPSSPTSSILKRDLSARQELAGSSNNMPRNMHQASGKYLKHFTHRRGA